MTDRYPVELHYVPHLDQVWVLNWRSEHNQGIKTIQIIRDAAQKRKHHTVHPEPIDGQFDLVRGLFMPPIQVRSISDTIISTCVWMKLISIPDHMLKCMKSCIIAGEVLDWNLGVETSYCTSDFQVCP